MAPPNYKESDSGKSFQVQETGCKQVVYLRDLSSKSSSDLKDGSW